MQGCRAQCGQDGEVVAGEQRPVVVQEEAVVNEVTVGGMSKEDKSGAVQVVEVVAFGEHQGVVVVVAVDIGCSSR